MRTVVHKPPLFTHQRVHVAVCLFHVRVLVSVTVCPLRATANCIQILCILKHNWPKNQMLILLRCCSTSVVPLGGPRSFWWEFSLTPVPQYLWLLTVLLYWSSRSSEPHSGALTRPEGLGDWTSDKLVPLHPGQNRWTTPLMRALLVLFMPLSWL